MNQDTGKNCIQISIGTSNKHDDASAFIIVTDPEYRKPFDTIPGAAYLAYAYPSGYMGSINDDGIAQTLGYSYAGTKPNIFIGNSQAVV